MSNLDIRSAESLRAEQLDRVQVIYEGAFARELRVPFGELARRGDADRMFAAVEGTAPVGFAALRLLESAEWTFLRYFAIAGERRSQGIGIRFWQLVRQSLREHGWPANIVLEVEHPGEAAADEAERATRDRRISFWSRCGAILLPAPGYVTPDYTGCGTTEAMLLMAAMPDAAPPLRADRLRALVLAIYTDRYGLAPDDPLVASALASIEG